ncbi:MAG: hypothetical protein JKY31_00750 [Rhodobacteraceae bacterium]|nr:hypothetical protein [Paracoccaceae bacterium]
MGRKDTSSVSRLVYDFGALILEPSYTRYQQDQMYMKKRRSLTADDASTKNLKRFRPLLNLTGLFADSLEQAMSISSDELQELSYIDDVLSALSRTIDVDLDVKKFFNTLNRKFKDSNLLYAPLNSKRILSEQTLKNCNSIQSMLREFPNVDEDDPASVMFDINIYQVLIDAEKYFRERGIVHSATYEYLKSYQERKGAGRPRLYIKIMLVVMLAEFFEKYSPLNAKAVIHDFSTDTDKDINGKILRYRKPAYDSAFAKLLVEFSQISNFVDQISHETHELDQYRRYLRNRADSQDRMNVTQCIRKSDLAVDFQNIIFYLDSIK